MKKMLINVCLCFIVIVSYNCNNGEYNMYTKINPNGTCSREFIQGADSAFVAGDTAKNPFPMKLDSTWVLTIHKKMTGDSARFMNVPSVISYKHGDSAFSYFAVARKEFSSVTDLAKTFRYDDSEWDTLVPRIVFNTSFRWFYTWYTFQETYPNVNPFRRIPISDYLSDSEIETWFGENKDLYAGKNGIEISEMLDKLEEKANTWLERSYYEEVFRLYQKYYLQLKGMPVDSATFAKEKDAMYKFIKDTSDKEDKSIFDDLESGFDAYFHTKAFKMDMNQDLSKKIDDELPDFTHFFGAELNYKLSMPGKVIESNAPFVNGDTLSWKVDAYRFFVKDYELVAVSRKPNYWAFGITGLIIALASLGFLVRRKT